MSVYPRPNCCTWNTGSRLLENTRVGISDINNKRNRAIKKNASQKAKNFDEAKGVQASKQSKDLNRVVKILNPPAE